MVNLRLDSSYLSLNAVLYMSDSIVTDPIAYRPSSSLSMQPVAADYGEGGLDEFLLSSLRFEFEVPVR